MFTGLASAFCATESLSSSFGVVLPFLSTVLPAFVLDGVKTQPAPFSGRLPVLMPVSIYPFGSGNDAATSIKQTKYRRRQI